MNLPIETKTLVHKQFALKIVLLYVLIGVLWILFSDEIFNYLFSHTGQFSSYVQYKRVVNIAITATLLYFLIRKTLQQTKTQQTLNTSIENWKFVLEGPGDGVWDWDLKNNEITHSPRWKEMFGYSDVALGETPEDNLKLIHSDDLKKASEDIADFIAGRVDVLDSEFRLQCADGSWKWVSSRGMLFYDKDGKQPIRVLGAHSDISARKLSEDKYFNLAHYDQITELPNRVLFLDRLHLDMKRSKKTGQSIALMYIDLDKFKEVNDTLGHKMGNVLLKEVADRLSSCIRVTDTVARMGGDEFTIVLNNLDVNLTADNTAEAILSKIAEPFQLGSDSVYITCSIGITTFPEDGNDVEVLLSNADQAMYAAKVLGRNRYNYFTANLQQRAIERMRLVNDLRVALQRKEFYLHYQPIVQLNTGEIHKAEALIRWQHPQRGLVCPMDFIPLAESTGLIVEIGDWVYEEAAKQVKIWRESILNFQISINKSPVQFRAGITHKKWLDYLETIDLPGSSMAIEITESLLLDSDKPIIDMLLEYRTAGIQVAVDDFGTGYSSLSYLHKFQMDYLKIDRSFTSKITTSASDWALCEVIIIMAHKLGMKVIAEGVETKEQMNLLLGAGCDYGQGYFFSQPVSASDFLNIESEQFQFSLPTFA